MALVTLNIFTTKGFRETTRLELPDKVEPEKLYNILIENVRKLLAIPLSSDKPYEILIFINGVDLQIYMAYNTVIELDNNTVIDLIIIRYGG